MLILFKDMNDKVAYIQIYRIEIKALKDRKLKIRNECFELRFKDKDGSYVRLWDALIEVENQKSFSSTKPKIATVKSENLMEETGVINVGETFSVFEYGLNTKVGTGKIIEILQQK